MSDEPGPAEPTSDLAHDLLARVRAAAASGADTARRTRKPTGRARRPASSSSSRPDDRDPQLIGPLVDGLVDEQGWQEALSVGGVEARWGQVVGSGIADHCRPERYADGVLVVRAESTAWATQVRLLAPTVVARLNAELGDGTVTRVDVLGPDGPSWRKGKFRVQGRGPRDTYG